MQQGGEVAAAAGIPPGDGGVEEQEGGQGQQRRRDQHLAPLALLDDQGAEREDKGVGEHEGTERQGIVGTGRQVAGGQDQRDDRQLEVEQADADGTG